MFVVISRYRYFDRGSHFVNEVVVEFLQLYEIQAKLTFGERGMEGRLGGTTCDSTPHDVACLWLDATKFSDEGVGIIQ